WPFSAPSSASSSALQRVSASSSRSSTSSSRWPRASRSSSSWPSSAWCSTGSSSSSSVGSSPGSTEPTAHPHHSSTAYHLKHPTPRRTVKTPTLALVAASVVALTLSACGSGDSDSSDAAATGGSSEQVEILLPFPEGLPMAPVTVAKVQGLFSENGLDDVKVS